MSARDAESGSSGYRGGSGSAGGLGNGGLGGGMGGGFGGGGAARMGGAGNQTGLGTGTTTFGNSAFGRAGGNAVAYGMRDAASLNRAGMGPTAGSFGNFRAPSGAAMFGGSPVQGQSFSGQNMGQALSQAARAQAAWQAARSQRPQVGGLLGGPGPQIGAAYNPLSSIQAPAYNPLVDVQPGLPPLTVDNLPKPPTAPMPGVDMHIGRPLMGGGYNPWSGNGAYPPGFGTQTAPGKTDFGDPQRVAPGKGNFQGNFNGFKGYY